MPSTATGEESIDAPPGMEARFVRRGWLEPGALKGTPLYCDRSDREADPKLPNEMLVGLIYWSFFRYRPEMHT